MRITDDQFHHPHKLSYDNCAAFPVLRISQSSLVKSRYLVQTFLSAQLALRLCLERRQNPVKLCILVLGIRIKHFRGEFVVC